MKKNDPMEELKKNIKFERRFWLSVVVLLMVSILYIAYFLNTDIRNVIQVNEQLEIEKAEALDQLEECQNKIEYHGTGN